MKMSHVNIPQEFNRNHPKIHHIPVEQSGSHLIRLAARRTDMPNLLDKDILDVGCGSRFAQTIINRDIAIKKYTGIDVDKTLIEYLSANIKDSRCSFYYWNIHNDAYNKTGEKLTKAMKLPSPDEEKFDGIWMFSVVTHLSLVDVENLMYVLRKYIKPNGRLLFSALIDNSIDSYENRASLSEAYADGRISSTDIAEINEARMQVRGIRSFLRFVFRFLSGNKNTKTSDEFGLKAVYNENALRKILANTGWQVDSFNKPAKFITHHFVCSPDPQFF